MLRAKLPAFASEEEELTFWDTADIGQYFDLHTDPGDDDGPVGQRYVKAGWASGLRRLWVIIEDEGKGRARVVTARPPLGEAEQCLHRQLAGD